MTPIKRELQYRRFIRDAEGMRDKNCRHCRHKRIIGDRLRCEVIGDGDSRYAIQPGYLCDRWER
jgi:hypothetical protein